MENLNLIEAIKEKNPTKVKIILSNNFLKDHTDKDGNIMKEFGFVKKEWPDIIEKHDNKGIIQDIDKWDKIYFTALKVDLMENFSEERFNHTYEVVKYIYRDENTNSNDSKPNSEKQNTLAVFEPPAKNNILVKVGAVVAVIIGVGYAIYKYFSHGK